MRYPSPGSGRERAPRLSWPSWPRIIPNQFLKRRDSIVEATKFLLGAVSFSPQLLQHLTYVGHPHLLSFFQYGKTASHLKPRSNGCLALSTGCAFIRACAVAGRSIKHCATRTPAGPCGTRSACRAGCVRRHGAAGAKKNVRLASVFPSPPFRSSDFAGRGGLGSMDSTLALGALRIARGAGGEAVREREPRRAGEGR